MFRLSRPAAPILRRAALSYPNPRAQCRGQSTSTSTFTLDALAASSTRLSLGQTHPHRFMDHYHTTLAEDLLYLTYNPTQPILPPAATHLPQPDPDNPYTLNRPQGRARGNRPLRPIAPLIRPETVPRLERIVLHTMVKEAIASKQALLPAIMAFRAITGVTARGGGIDGAEGVRIVSSRAGAAAFKLRSGVPIAVTAELKAGPMWDFLQTLTEFVLPRMREFSGVIMPPASASPTSPSAVSGVVAFGLPATAMALFPQIEFNFDSYPRTHGFHIHFITNARGKGAQDRARTLLSGFRIPFVRR